MRYMCNMLFICFSTLCFLYSISITAQEVSRFQIPVEEEGKQLLLPWVGGLNAPQIIPAFFDEDNRPDLLVFDRIGDVPIPLINQGGPNEVNYRFQPSYKSQLPLLSGWVVIRDFDQDGIADYFTSSQPVSGVFGVSVYKGKEVDGELEYELLLFDHKQYLVVPAGNSTTNLYVSWEDIPAIEDVDGDGDLDVLSFEPGGSFITYYRNFSVENGWGLDSMNFDIEDHCWGKILESEISEELFLSDDPNKCSDGMILGDPVINTRHSGSTIAAFDQDLDGDMDALIGDITSTTLVFVKNGGNAEEAWITEQDAHWPSYNTSVDNPFFNAGFIVDVNNDMHPDILSAVNSRSFAEDGNVIWYYRNTGVSPDQQYELIQKDLFTDEMLDFGSETNPAFADVNADGLIDLVIGAFRSDQETQSRIPSLHLLLNQGTATQPSFVLEDDDYLGMSQYATIPTWALAPAFGDLDQDGDDDLIVGEFNGQLFYYENSAGAGQPYQFDAPDFPFEGIDIGSASAPCIYDVNQDGLNDLIIGERNTNFGTSGNCGALNYFQNIGSMGNAEFQPDESAFPNTNCFGNVILNDIPGLPVFSKPFVIETDEGVKLVVGSDEGGLQLYGDILTQVYGSFALENVDYGNIREGFKTSGAFSDLDGDGLYDVIIGNRRGGVSAYHTDLIKLTTSVEASLNEKSGLILRPNPAQDYVHIQLRDQNQIIRIELMTPDGILLHSRDSSNDILMDLSEFLPGVYILVAETKKGRLIEKLVIHQ